MSNHERSYTFHHALVDGRMRLVSVTEDHPETANEAGDPMPVPKDRYQGVAACEAVEHERMT